MPRLTLWILQPYLKVLKLLISLYSTQPDYMKGYNEYPSYLLQKPQHVNGA